MKRVLFVINTLGGAGAEKALLELLKRFTPDRYEVDLYVLLEQGELISQVPGYVNILNRDYTACLLYTSGSAYRGIYHKLAGTMVCICGTYRNCSCHSAWSDIYYPAKDYLW